MRVHQGFHLYLSNGKHLLARIDRSDVNSPDYDGFSFNRVLREAQFEVAAYQHLKAYPRVHASELVLYRFPEIPKEGDSIVIDG